MNRQYIEYQDTLRKYSRQKAAVVWWWILAGYSIVITLAALIAVVPLGIIFSIPCSFWLWFTISRTIRCRRTWGKVKEYQAIYKPSTNIRGDTTYCFAAPFSMQDTINKVREVLLTIGNVESIDTSRGIIRGTIRISTKEKRSVTIYVSHGDHQCQARACFHRLANDEWWDIFLYTLFARNPGADFGVSLANGDPQVVGVLNLRGDTKQVSFSRTTGGTSLGGFLIGGALFGDTGAIVGGLSGNQRTVTNTRTVFSNELLVRIIYSNGRLWEGTVVKGSQLYHEIMVNMSVRSE